VLDYYLTLGVARTANEAEIKAAFRQLALKCHPDHCPGDEAAAKRFAELRSAHDVLVDQEKRKRYDAMTAAIAGEPSALTRYRKPPGPTCVECGGTGEATGFTGFHYVRQECSNCFGLGTTPWATVARPEAPRAKQLARPVVPLKRISG
jgi:DnaJ-class molecular chaperone